MLTIKIIILHRFELSDGQSQQSEGTIEGLGTEDEAASVKGSFSFVGDDGQTYTVTYIADKNGKESIEGLFEFVYLIK